MVKSADIVVTITTASEPLFDGRWLKPGAHVTAAGSNALIRREIDETVIRRAAVVAVDSRATALRRVRDGRTGRIAQWHAAGASGG
jgi:alanine dehydrogenase